MGEPELGKEGIHMVGHPRAVLEPKLGEKSTHMYREAWP